MGISDQLDYLDTDSESENEDIVIEKLKSKFSQLLTGWVELFKMYFWLISK